MSTSLPAMPFRANNGAIHNKAVIFATTFYWLGQIIMVYMCVFANFGNFSLRPPVTQGGSSPTGELVLNLVDAWVHSHAS